MAFLILLLIFYELIPLLENDFYIAALDFPGSGFSDKPLDGFSYMLAENAQILDYFVTDIVQFDDFAMFTHDRGEYWSGIFRELYR